MTHFACHARSNTFIRNLGERGKEEEEESEEGMRIRAALYKRGKEEKAAEKRKYFTSEKFGVPKVFPGKNPRLRVCSVCSGNAAFS